MTPAELVRALPDDARWVCAHGLAGDPGTWCAAIDDGAALGNERAKLIAVVGAVGDHDAGARAVAELARTHPTHALLLPRELAHIADAVRATGRVVARAIVHTLPDAHALPQLDGAAPLSPEVTLAGLAHVPRDLADELEAARARTTVWASWLDGAPVCFAYAPWRSARWFDVSVETVPGARQLGLATITAAAMIEAERAGGREPAWSADDGHVASRRLATALGLVPTEALWIAAPGHVGR